MMKTFLGKWSLFRRSVWHYRKLLLGVSAGAALTAMIITGALLIGDAVQGTLLHLAENRLGQVKSAVFTQERWFRAALAEELEQRFEARFAALVSLQAYATAPQHKRGIAVSLYGVGPDFFAFAPREISPPLQIQPGEVYLNTSAANSLNVQVGDTLVLRTFKPSRLPGDAPLSQTNLARFGTALTVAGILDGPNFGDFNPQTTQALAPQVFVNRAALAEKLNRPDRANVLLSDAAKPLLAQWKDLFQLEDYGLEVRARQKEWELVSERVFIAPAVDAAATQTNVAQKRIFGYFVNAISCGGQSVPYSFIAGMQELPGGVDLHDEDILVNQWLAEQLNCPVGATVQLSAYRPKPFGALEEVTFDFTLRAVLPMSDPALDPSLMPQFPGLEDADSCRDWDSSLPIDLTRIRPQDEEYWERYRGTPKAFVTLSAAQERWGNRFGALTAIRFQTELSQAQLSAALLKNLQPQNLGFRAIELKSETALGIQHAVDFSGLFLALSFFIIIAALLLTVMLFNFYLEKRYREYAVLQTIGFKQRTIWLLYTCEGLLCSACGSLLGVLAGILYARIMIQGLNTLWQGAVSGAQLELFIPVATLMTGGLVSTGAVLLALALSAKRFLASTAGAKLRGEVRIKRIHSRRTGLSALVFFALAVLCLVGARERLSDAGLFFLTGFLILLATTQGSAWILAQTTKFSGRLTVLSLAMRNCVRRSDRSLAVIRLLACGIFLILAVTVNRQGLVENPQEKTAGTGGFTYYLETAVPVKLDMNARAGREALKLEGLSPEVAFVQIPTIPGSEASCLNLNHVVRPFVSGIDPAALTGRFRFSKTLPETGTGWQVLEHAFQDPDTIPVVADMNVILWSLGKKLGEELEFENSAGKTYRLRFIGGLDNSLFQGRVLVSLKNFYRLYPEATGSTVALVEVPAGLKEATADILVRAFSGYGLNLEPSAERLNRFNAVQNTYLSVFLALGGIGLMLGCGGLAILIHRNLMERHSELTFLRTVGYTEKVIQQMLFAEHFVLFILAVCCGFVSAGVALIPTLQSASAGIPWGEISLFVSLILFWGIASIFTAIRFREEVDLPALRQLDT